MTDGRHRRQRFVAAGATAAAVLAVVGTLLLIRSWSSGSAAPASAPFVGHQWRVVALDDEQGHLAVPADQQGSLNFLPGGRMLLVASPFLGGRVSIDVVSGGYTVRESDGDGGGWTAYEPPSARVVTAYQGPFGDAPSADHVIRVSVTGSTLTLHAGRVTLTAERDGAAAPAPSTPSRYADYLPSETGRPSPQLTTP